MIEPVIIQVALQVGDRLKDNDPRVGGSRYLTVVEVLPNGVLAKHPGHPRVFPLLRRRIHTDGKPRKGGFDLVRD